MKALVVYDSFFTNTEQIARAIATGLGGVSVVKVDTVRPEQLTGLDPLIQCHSSHYRNAERTSCQRPERCPSDSLRYPLPNERDREDADAEVFRGGMG